MLFLFTSVRLQQWQPAAVSNLWPARSSLASPI